MSTPVADVYTNKDEDSYPGARQRSKPGTAPDEEIYDKVLDSSGRLVSSKPANKAFLTSQSRRAEHLTRVEADRVRRSQARSTSFFSRIQTVILLLAFLPLLSQFLTSTYTFNTSPYVLPRINRIWKTSPLNVWQKEMIVFTPVQLARYDGSDPELPVYLGIDGSVYDVSRNRRVYGKGGSYNMMAGRDASRSFVTGCFETHLTHDLRGLSDADLQSLHHWKSFFANRADYPKIGSIINPPINPRAPIPARCNEAVPGEQAAKEGRGRPEPVQETGRPQAG